jgi:SOS-response transcriptional repressor LexA
MNIFSHTGKNKRKEILEFIKGYISEHQYPPTRIEIGEGCGIKSTSVVNYHLGIMVRENMIELDEGVSRGIRVK